MRSLKRLLPLALVCFASLGLAQTAKPVVAVTIPPQIWLVRELAGDVVEPMVVVRADQDPHTFEPTANHLAALSKAKLWLTMGLPFEETVHGRLTAISPGMAIVPLHEGLVETEHGHGAHCHGCTGGHDPHIWLSPPLMAALATNTCAALVTLLPEEKARLRDGLSRVTGKILAVDRSIRELLAGKKTRVFWVQHPSWGYFAKAYGLEQKSLERHGAEPTPRQLARLSDDAAKTGVKVLFSDPRHDSRLMEVVAGQIGAEVVPIDPLAEDWDGNLLSVAGRLSDAVPAD